MLHGAAKLSEEVNDFFWGWWGLADGGSKIVFHFKCYQNHNYIYEIF